MCRRRRWPARRVALRPARGTLLALSKHRAREKVALRAAGAETAPFVEVSSGGGP